MYRSKIYKKNKFSFIKKQGGAVLPIVLISIFLLQISFYGAFRIYENKMNTYGVLVNHYQVQTILSDAETVLTVQYVEIGKHAPSSIYYNIGTVTILKKNVDTYELKSTLSNGYSEKKDIIIPTPTRKNNILDKKTDSADDKHRLF